MSKRIDYDAHPEIATEIRSFIQESLSKLIQIDANKDWVDTIVYLTDKGNNFDKDHIQGEIFSLIEVR